LIKTYSPAGGLHDVDSVLKGIDKIERRDRYKYLSDTEMARLTDDKIIKLALLRRIFVFQLILNFIEEAVSIVSVNEKIDKITENYTHMMKVSQKALNHLQGTSEKAGPERGAPRSQ
jgi:hypothetical protein